MKRIFKQLLAVLILATTGALTASAEVLTGSCGRDIIYTLDTQTGILTLSGSGGMDYSIPWVTNRASIRTVKVGEGINVLTNYAFAGCYNLESVTLPKSIKSIYGFAFAFTGLKSVELPDSLTSINNAVFMGCDKLVSVRIPKSVTGISRQAFYYCDNLKRIICEGEIPPTDYMNTQFSMDKSGIKLYVPENATETYASSPIWNGFDIRPADKIDDDIAPATEDKLPMTMFEINQTYTTNGIFDRNTAILRWYTNEKAYGYQIKWAYQEDVSSGQEAWEDAEAKGLILGDTVLVGTNVDNLTIKHLNYAQDYRFAIRVLHSADLTDPANSRWYGYGGGLEWDAYYGLMTEERYPVPIVIYANQAQRTETTLHICLKTNLSQVSTGDAWLDDENETSYRENFNIDENGNFGYKYLVVSPSSSNPDAYVGDKWKKYEITAEDRARGYIVVDGLVPNAEYIIDVIDPTVEALVDAKYNTVLARTDGKPGEPILLNHADLIAQYANASISEAVPYNRAEVYGPQANEYDAAPISPILKSVNNYADGQTFWLEGGKTYYLDGNDAIHNGLVLRTAPKDLAEGKRARVLCGLGKHSTFMQGSYGEQWNGCPYAMFTLGRSAEVGEENAVLHMKKLAFYDIDFDNPKAFNYGDQAAKAGSATGNYFINMPNDGMAMTIDSLVIQNCSFKRIVRGFIREQGSNYKIWNHVLIQNNMFMDCGYYNMGAGGYCWIDCSGNNAKSNLYADLKILENTFYDCPFPAFIREERAMFWDANIVWNITFSNNTLVNFNTRGNGSIFKMRYLPDGSVYTVENNLIMLCKQPGDTRILECYGADIRETWNANGEMGYVTLNFNNNWSTNNDLTNGQIFSDRPWTSTSNNFGKLVKNNLATLNGTLDVNVANISATELMEQPCPPHIATTMEEQNMHRADALDGTATTEFNVNLFFKDTDAVRNSEIYKLGVGAARWRKSVTDPESIETLQNPTDFDGKICVYNIAGRIVKETKAIPNGNMDAYLSDLPVGIYLIKSYKGTFKIIR